MYHLFYFLVAKKRPKMVTPTIGLESSTARKPLGGCNSNQFRCNNGICLQKSLRCNQRNDCGDHSDEINCAGAFLILFAIIFAHSTLYPQKLFTVCLVAVEELLL